MARFEINRDFIGLTRKILPTPVQSVHLRMLPPYERKRPKTLFGVTLESIRGFGIETDRLFLRPLRGEELLSFALSRTTSDDFLSRGYLSKTPTSPNEWAKIIESWHDPNQRILVYKILEGERAIRWFRPISGYVKIEFPKPRRSSDCTGIISYGITAPESLKRGVMTEAVSTLVYHLPIFFDVWSQGLFQIKQFRTTVSEHNLDSAGTLLRTGFRIDPSRPLRPSKTRMGGMAVPMIREMV